MDLLKLEMANVKNPKFKDVSTANGYYKAIAALAEHGIISGYGDGRYGRNDPIKRGQVASINVDHIGSTVYVRINRNLMQAH